MSADVTPIRPGVACLKPPAGTLREVEEVWRLRGQVLEHVKAIESLCKRMLELPHVWGVCPADVTGRLDEIEAMLTPEDPEDGVDPEPGDSDYRQWRLWLAFRDAQGIGN